jgi:WD40 repeat protein
MHICLLNDWKTSSSKFLVVSGASNGEIKCFNSESLRTIWTIAGKEKRKTSTSASLLSVDVIEFVEREKAWYSVVAFARDGTMSLFWYEQFLEVSVDDDGRGDEDDDFFPPEMWRREPNGERVILKTKSECHTFCRLSNIIVTAIDLKKGENEDAVKARLCARPSWERGSCEVVLIDVGYMRERERPTMEVIATLRTNMESKFGSVSAIRFLSQNTVCVGYESGHVVLFRDLKKRLLLLNEKKDIIEQIEEHEMDENDSSSVIIKRVFKDMVTCIDSRPEDDLEEEEEEDTHRVVFGCAEGEFATFLISEKKPYVFKEYGQRRGPFASKDDTKKGVSDVSLRFDKKLLAVAYWDGKTRVFSEPSTAPISTKTNDPRSQRTLLCSLKTEKRISTDDHPSVAMVKFRDDYRVTKNFELLTCTRDGSLRLWPIFPRSELQ